MCYRRDSSVPNQSIHLIFLLTPHDRYDQNDRYRGSIPSIKIHKEIVSETHSE